MGLLVATIFIGGAASAAVAAGKGRNPIGWLVMGALFPLIGVIVVLLLPGELSRRVSIDAAPHVSTPDLAHSEHFKAATFDALQRLVEGKARGQLTNLEFAEKRAELLAR